MKSYKINILLVAILLVSFMESCKKDFFTSVNNNPNAVSNVDPSLVLPSAEISLAFTQGGDLERYSSLITQQVFGQQNQTQTFYKYGINPGTFDNGWADVYTGTMENDYTLMLDADKRGYSAYSGISRILMAYTLQVTVDYWGKVPYSQALHGNLAGGSLQPAYDDDKALYDTIASLVDVATAQLANPTGNLPSTDDVIYGGNLGNWIKFGHAIKARLYIHQSKGNATMATNALSEIAQSFTSNADNAQYLFAGEPGATEAPWFQFNRDRELYISFSNSTLATEMSGLSDPRSAVYFDPSGTDGAQHGNHFGDLNDYYGAANSPVEFITYDELLFMKAEATLRASGDYAAAEGFYQDAIQHNFDKLGISADGPAYITAHGTLPKGSVDAAIGQVASQEFIALYLNPEAWTLWRRTNTPTLLPVTGSDVPRRLLYPQSEYDYNSANVSPSTLTAPRIFWDN